MAQVLALRQGTARFFDQGFFLGQKIGRFLSKIEKFGGAFRFARRRQDDAVIGGDFRLVELLIRQGAQYFERFLFVPLRVQSESVGRDVGRILRIFVVNFARHFLSALGVQ